MDHEDGLHVRGERGGELLGAKVVSVLVRLDKHRAETALGDGEDRSNIGVGGDRDGVAILEQAELFPPT